jgi:hypothetical protein
LRQRLRAVPTGCRSRFGGARCARAAGWRGSLATIGAGSSAGSRMRGTGSHALGGHSGFYGAGPVVYLLDESSFDRVGRDVHELVHHVGGVDEVDNADLLARPEVLRAPGQCVLDLVARSLWQCSGARAWSRGDRRSRCGGGWTWRTSGGPRCQSVTPPLRAVEEGIVGRLVGMQQELALRAAARDHVESAGNDLARQNKPGRQNPINPGPGRNQPRGPNQPRTGQAARGRRCARAGDMLSRARGHEVSERA